MVAGRLLAGARRRRHGVRSSLPAVDAAHRHFLPACDGCIPHQRQQARTIAPSTNPLQLLPKRVAAVEGDSLSIRQARWFGTCTDDNHTSDDHNSASARPTRVHLPRLGQNGTLVVRSESDALAKVEIVPGWRDDAVLELRPMSAGDGGFDAHDVRCDGSGGDAALGGDANAHTFGNDTDPQSGSLEQTIGRLQVKSITEGIETSLGRRGNLVEVDVLPSPSEEPAKIVATVPEKSNVTIQVASGDIYVAGKLEGDAHLSAGNGNIAVSKLRGHNVTLEAGGRIHVKKAVEARSVKFRTSSRIRARMINGSNVAINVNAGPDCLNLVKLDDDDEGAAIDVGSLYVSGSGAESDNEAIVNVDGESDKYSRGLVRVKSTHGHVTVHAKINPNVAQDSGDEPRQPLVDLGGINGSCDVDLESSLSVDESWNDEDCTATRVHFDAMSPESISTITIRGNTGGSSITMDRKLEAEVRLLSVAGSEATLPVDVDAHTLTGDDTEDLLSVLTNLDASIDREGSAGSGDSIAIETDAFAGKRGLGALGLEEYGRVLSPCVQYAQGTMSNRSGEPDSRFDVRSRGKINIDGAASQALHGFQGKRKEPELGSSPAAMPLLAVATDGKIKLETLSWFGSIARRYGLEEDDKRGVGRQASRSPRLEEK